MKNSILNLGKTLNKAEQKNIYGGYKTKESCDAMDGFWGLSLNTGKWCCTIPSTNTSYC